jgi:hypothetical protein
MPRGNIEKHVEPLYFFAKGALRNSIKQSIREIFAEKRGELFIGRTRVLIFLGRGLLAAQNSKH